VQKILFPKLNKRRENSHKKKQIWLNLPRDIPHHPQDFYADFGLLKHPKTGQPVPRLTAYQIDTWIAGFYHKYRLAVKSQKIGLSTSVLLEDFQHAITDCIGHELLLIAQTIPHAREHLYTLRRMILQSKKYSPYLISKPTQVEMAMRDEVTKVTVIYIHNPDNPRKPTRIIGLGANEASIWSWKEVKFIHISDLAVVNKTDYSGVISAALTRLANTDGSMIIESPPFGTHGKIYEIYQQSKLHTKSPEGQFWTTTIPAREAVQAGLISQEFLDGERVRLGHMYPAYYEAEFLVGFGNLFIGEIIDEAEKLGSIHKFEPDQIDPYTPKALGIDYGMGSSSTAFVLLENLNDSVIRVLVAEQFDRPNFNDMVARAFDIISQYNLKRVGKVYVDNSAPEFIRELKIMAGETADYEPIIWRFRQQHKDLNDSGMNIIPVPFSIYNDAMTQKAKSLMDSHLIAVDSEKFQELILDLRNAKVDDKGKLEKDETNKMDLFDGLRLALRFFNINPQ
jgi:hypothetical protein